MSTAAAREQTPAAHLMGPFRPLLVRQTLFATLSQENSNIIQNVSLINQGQEGNRC